MLPRILVLLHIMEIVSQPSRKKYARVKVEAGVEESETDDTIFLGDFSRNQVHRNF